MSENLSSAPHDRPDIRGAPCGFCWQMLFAYSPTCATCRLRPFGSAPCLDDLPDSQECPGSDCCPNGKECIDILKREWPLAEVALKMAGAIP